MERVLSRHITKFAETIDNSELTVNCVVDHLLNTYPQYKLDDIDKLRDFVGNEVQAIVKSRSKEPTLPASTSTSSLLSLNRSMSTNSIRSGSAMKRQKLTDPSMDGDEASLAAAPVVVVTEQLETVTIDESGEVGQTPAKKVVKKVNTKKKTSIAETDIIGDINKSMRPSVSFLTNRPTARLSDLAGLEPVLRQIRELVFYPIQYPHLYTHLGVSPPCGILLHGPSGCGKTSLACAIAGELGLPFFRASGPELVGGTSGESEERIRQIFEAAAASAPSVLFIDALDVIAAKKDSSQRGMERRIVAQLFDSIDFVSEMGRNAIKQKTISADAAATSDGAEIQDDKNESEKPKNGTVILIVATNKPDSLDPGVRGRFSREIALPVPDAPSRTKILQLMTSHMTVGPSVDFVALGKATPGFVGADLQALTREAGMIAVSRIVAETEAAAAVAEAAANVAAATVTEAAVTDTSMVMDDDHEPVVETNTASNMGDEATKDPASAATEAPVVPFAGCVEMLDFTLAAKSIQPTAKREGFAVAPDVTWSDVGALAEVREELLHNVLEPIAHPERFRSLGLEVPAGVLFFGPPGCGKTLLAKALANQSGANFISVKGPELLNMYVGESESRVRQVFTRARASAPCVIFFDELDALCPKRGSGAPEGGGGSGNGVSERVVNQLLTELDGLESRRDVYIIAATNRLELIDDAMLRPGRLGKLLYVPLPSSQDRVSILRALTRKVSVNLSAEGGVNLEAIGSDARSEGFSGADLAALVREAGLAVVREIIDANNAPQQLAGKSANMDDYSSRANRGGSSSGTNVQSVQATQAIQQHQHDIEQYSNLSIHARHFELAFGKVKASVSEMDRRRYDLVQDNIRSGMGAIQALKEAAQSIGRIKKQQLLQQNKVPSAAPVTGGNAAANL